MYLTRIKNVHDFKPHGNKVDLVMEGDKLLQITLTSNGKTYVIKPGESYSTELRLFVAEQYRKEKRHVLEGEVAGLKVHEAFATAHEAQNRKAELMGYMGSAGDLTITEKEVVINPDAEAPGAPEAFAEVPF